jgi:WD40 repeat protein
VATAGADDNTARVWDGRTGRPVGQPMRQPMKGDNSIVAVSISPDGARLAASYLDFTLRLWDTASGEPIGHSMKTHSVAYALAFSPTGHVIGSGGDDGTIRLWDVDSQSQLGAAFKDHTRAVESLYFNNDGTKLVSDSDDNTIRVWPVLDLTSDAADAALCSKLTHNMASQRWNDLVPSDIDYVEGCGDLPEDTPAG